MPLQYFTRNIFFLKTIPYKNIPLISQIIFTEKWDIFARKFLIYKLFYTFAPKLYPRRSQWPFYITTTSSKFYSSKYILPSVSKERTTLWPLVSCCRKLFYRFDITITKIAVAITHVFKATQMDRHSQIQEYAVFVHSILNIVHHVVHFIHWHTEFAKIIFNVATSFSWAHKPR